MSRATTASMFSVKPKPSVPSAVRTRADQRFGARGEAQRMHVRVRDGDRGGHVSSAPDLARDLDDALELAPLLVRGQRVAVVRAGEAALRRQAEVLEGNEFGGCLDAFLIRKSLFSSSPTFVVTSPSTTFLPFGR